MGIFPTLYIYVCIGSLHDESNLVIPYCMCILLSTISRVLLDEVILLHYKQRKVQRGNQHYHVSHKSNDFLNVKDIFTFVSHDFVIWDIKSFFAKTRTIDVSYITVIMDYYPIVIFEKIQHFSSLFVYI
jgi:hypothetical protein